MLLNADDLQFLNNKKILITGITGTLGKKLLKNIYNANLNIHVIGISRDEEKQYDLGEQYGSWPWLVLYQGDVRDKQRLLQVISSDIDVIIHAAALKMVPSCELYPFEAVKTNVYGTQNIIDVAIERDIKTVLSISTDKGVHPYNLYGLTKATQEKLILAANFLPSNSCTDFMCVRYGNVMNSRGSVIPIFTKQVMNNDKITITDGGMTRFLLTQQDACVLVFKALELNLSGTILTKKFPACTISDLATGIMKLYGKQLETISVGIRDGEKIHEELFSGEEIRNSVSFEDYIQIDPFGKILNNVRDGYTSDKARRLTIDEIVELLREM